MSLQDIKNKRKGGSALIHEGMVKLDSEDILGKTVTIINVDVVNTKNGICGVLIFKEFEESFYFTGSVLTELCKDIVADPEALDQVRSEGLKVKIFMDKSDQTGRNYVNFKFA